MTQPTLMESIKQINQKQTQTVRHEGSLQDLGEQKQTTASSVNSFEESDEQIKATEYIPVNWSEVFSSGYNGPEGIFRNPNHRSRPPRNTTFGTMILNSQVSSNGYDTTPYISKFTVYIRGDFRSVSIPQHIKSDVKEITLATKSDKVWGALRTQYVETLGLLWKAQFFRSDFDVNHRTFYLEMRLKHKNFQDMWGRPLEIKNKDLRKFLAIIKNFKYFSDKLATDFNERWLTTTHNVAIGHMKNEEEEKDPYDFSNFKFEERNDVPQDDKKENLNFFEKHIHSSFSKVIGDISEDASTSEKIGVAIKNALGWLKDDILSELKESCDDIFAYIKSTFNAIIDWFKRQFGVIEVKFRQWAAEMKAYLFIIYTKIAESLAEYSSILYEYFKNFFQDFLGIDLDEDDYVEGHALGASIVSFILRCVLKFTGVPLSNDEMSMVRESISIADNMIESSKNFFKSLMFAFTGDKKYLYGNVGLEVLKFIKIATDLQENPETAIHLATNSEFREDFANLINSIEKYKLELVHKNSKVDRLYITQLNKITNDLTKMIRAANLRDSSPRKQPLLLVLYGPPGHGKSTLSEVLRIFMEWLYAGTTYVRTPNSDYQDGAQGAKVWLCPDFAQKKSVDERAKEMEEVIRFTSSENVPLNCSAVEDKGRYYFEGMGYILTTNASVTHEHFGVTDIGAFKRRGLHIRISRAANVNFGKGLDWETFIKLADQAWKLELSVEGGQGEDVGYKSGRDFLQEHLNYVPEHFQHASKVNIKFSQLMTGIFKRHQECKVNKEPSEFLYGNEQSLIKYFDYQPAKTTPKIDKHHDKTKVEEEIEQGEGLLSVISNTFKSSGHCLTSNDCYCPATTERRKHKIITFMLPYFKASKNRIPCMLLLDVFVRAIYDQGFSEQVHYWRNNQKQLVKLFAMDSGPLVALKKFHQIFLYLRLLKTEEDIPKSEGLSFFDELEDFPGRNSEKDIQRIASLNEYSFIELAPVKPNWALLSFVVITATALSSVIGGIAYAINKAVDKVMGHGVASDLQKKKLRKRPNTKSSDKKALQEISGHGLSVPPSVHVAKIRANMRKVTVVDKQGAKMTVNALFIGGLTMAINRHTGVETSNHIIMSAFDNKSSVWGQNTISNRDYTVRVTDNSDLAFVEFRKGVSNINESIRLDKYIFRGDYRSLDIKAVFRINPGDGSVEHVSNPYPINTKCSVDCMPSLIVKDYWSVPGLKSMYGHCGVPYIAEINNEWKILWLHAAALQNGNAGVVPFIEHNMVIGHAARGVDWTSDIDKLFKSTRKVNSFDICMSSRLADSTVNYSGKGGMTYKKHPWSNFYDPSVIPNEKRPIERKGNNTHQKFQNRRLRNIDPVTDDLASMAENDPGSLWSGFLSKMPIWKGGINIRSTDEVLLECEYFETLSKESSEGLWKQLKPPGTPDKKQIVDSGIVPKALNDAVEERMEMLLKGVYPLGITALATKAELLPFEKIHPRIFMPTSYPDIIVWKRVIGDLMQLLSTNPTLICLARYNPHGIQSKLIYDTIRKFSNYIATDAKGLDNSQRPLMSHLFGLFMARLTGKPEEDEHYKAVYALCSNVTQYLFVFRDGVYHSHMGLPSGSYVTALFNAFSMYVVLKYLCMVAYPGVAIDQIVSFICFGDDTAGSVNRRYKLINMLTFAYMGKMNFGYSLTNSEKEEITYKYEKEMPDFLSRDFKIIEGRVAHALKMSSICGFLHWSQKSTPREEILQQTVNVALMECVYHGRETFEKFRNQFLRAASEGGDVMNIKTWKYYYGRWISGYLGTQYPEHFYSQDDFMLSWFDDHGPDVSGKFLNVGSLSQAEGHSLKTVSSVNPKGLINLNEATRIFDQQSLAILTGMTHPQNGVSNTYENKETGGSLNLADNQSFETQNVTQLTELDKVEGEVNQNATDTVAVLSPGHYAMTTKDTPLEILSRQYVLGRFTVTGGTLSSSNFGFHSIYEKHSLPRTIIDKFKYFRCDGIKFDISVSSPIAASGFLVAYWYPAPPQNTGLPIFVRRNKWEAFIPNGAAVVALSESESTCLEVRWQAPFKFVRSKTLPTSPTFVYPSVGDQLKTMGTLYYNLPHIYVVDSDASPSITLRIFASYINPRLQAPRSTYAGAAVVEGHSERTSISATAAAVGATLANIGMHMTADNIKTFMNGWSAANKTFKDAQTLYQETNDIMFPDKDEPQGSHMSVRQSVWGDTSSLRPECKILNLGDNSNMMPVDRNDTALDDDVDIYDLCKRWQYAGDWAYDMTKDGTANGVGHRIGPAESPEGYLQFFSRFFRFWRGSMHIKLMFFGSPLITYNALIAVQPTNRRMDVDDDTLGQLGDVITNNVTLRGTTVVDVIVPFMRPSSWERINTLETFSISVDVWPIGSTQGDSNDVKLPILMLVRAGEDFRFRGLQSPSLVKLEGKTYQEGNLEIDLPHNTAFPVVQGHGLLDHADSVMDISDGNIVPLYEYQAFKGSLKDMITRCSTRPSNAFLRPPGRNIMDAPTLVSMQIQLANSDIFDWIATMYVGYSGSTRIKAQFEPDPGGSNPDDLAIYMESFSRLPDTASSGREVGSLRGGDGCYRTKLAVWPIIETEIPYFNIWPWSGVSTWTYVAEFTDSSVDYTMSLVEDPNAAIITGQGETPALANDSMVQAGNDFAFHILLPPLSSSILPNIVSHAYAALRQSPFKAKKRICEGDTCETK